MDHDALFVLNEGLRENIWGFCFSSLNMLKNVQLASEGTVPYSVEMDGTFKLCYADWVFIICGTHSTEYNTASRGFTHSFRPISYMYTKAESEDAFTVLLKATKSTVAFLFGIPFSPSCCISDRYEWHICSYCQPYVIGLCCACVLQSLCGFQDV